MADPIRVLHVITRLEPGGAQRNTLYTVGHLDRQRFKAGLSWGPGDLLDDAASALEGVELAPVEKLVRPVAPREDLGALGQLRRVIRWFAPDVLHTHSSKAGVLGRLAARLEGVGAVVHSIHGFGFTPLQPLPVRAAFYAAERLAAHWTDHFIAVSELNLRLGVELGLFEPEKVSLIRSGIEIARFARPPGAGAVKERLGVPPTARLVCQIGNFKPQKAPLDFVAVAAIVARSFEDVRFVMVGDGVLRPEAERAARALNVADRMVFCGWWDDIPGLLAATSVSVLTSRHEGLPRAIVESLAAGVPVVATAVDGTVEVVCHGVNGLLAPPGDVGALAEGVRRLLSSADEHTRMAAAAPEGLEEFDIDLMVRQQEELYRCLSGRSRI